MGRTFSGPVLRAVDRSYAHECDVSRSEIRQGAVVSVDETWREQSLDAKWTVAYRLSVQRGALVVGEVRVFPTENDEHRPAGTWSAGLRSSAKLPLGGLRAKVLRKFRLLDGLRRALPHLEAAAADWRAFTRGTAGRRAGLLEDFPTRPRPSRRRPRVPDTQVRRVAVQYRRAYRKDPRRPNAIVCQVLRLKRRRVTELVWLARQRGFLSPSDRGQRGKARC